MWAPASEEARAAERDRVADVAARRLAAEREHELARGRARAREAAAEAAREADRRVCEGHRRRLPRDQRELRAGALQQAVDLELAATPVGWPSSHAPRTLPPAGPLEGGEGAGRATGGVQPPASGSAVGVFLHNTVAVTVTPTSEGRPPLPSQPPPRRGGPGSSWGTSL